MATASPIRDAFHQQGTGQALHTRCRPFSGTARTITTLLRPLRIHRAGLGPAHRSQPRPRAASWTQRRLPTSATIFTEHGHTKRPTIPRTKLAISALFAAPAGPRLRAARHREALLKPPGWHPKTPAAPAGKLRDSLRAVAPEADSNACRAPPVTDRSSTGPDKLSRTSNRPTEAWFRPSARTV
jgi:hypothetical protein